MITRPYDNALAITAFENKTFHSCTVSGFTCTCGAIGSVAFPAGLAGPIIDQRALPEKFESVSLIAVANGAVQTSDTPSVNYLGVALGLQDNATTCVGGWADYSTADWPAERGLQNVTTATSTGSNYYSVAGQQVATPLAGILSTATVAAGGTTSTGYAKDRKSVV